MERGVRLKEMHMQVNQGDGESSPAFDFLEEIV